MRQDGSNKISGQENVSRVFVCPHSCMESICAIQSKCQPFACVASHFHSELARDSDADIGKVSLSTGSSVALPRAHPE